jgi:hypothetical protein
MNMSRRSTYNSKVMVTTPDDIGKSMLQEFTTTELRTLLFPPKIRKAMRVEYFARGLDRAPLHLAFVVDSPDVNFTTPDDHRLRLIYPMADGTFKLAWEVTLGDLLGASEAHLRQRLTACDLIEGAKPGTNAAELRNKRASRERSKIRVVSEREA